VTEGPDPERLLAEALRAQAISTPLPPAGPLPVDEPAAATDQRPGSGGTGSGTGSNGTGGDARLVELLSGVGHGLLSGHDPGTANVPYVGVPTDRTGPVGTTKLTPNRAQLAWWWMLLLAIALGLACGAVAGILTLV
jgi:hypothetical protein